MSKMKKYTRVYVNGKKVQSTGSHADDRKRMIDMWMLNNPEEDIRHIFRELAGKQYSCQHQAVIEIEIMGDCDGKPDGQDTIYPPYRLINASPVLLDDDFITSPNFKFESTESVFDKSISIDGYNNWILITDDEEFSKKLPFPNIYVPKNVFVSDRDIPLVSWVNGVITCENWCKHYSLFYITEDNKVMTLTDMFEDAWDIEGLDHSWEPASLVEFALRHDLKIGYESYKALCMQYADYRGKSETPGDTYIPKHSLPSSMDLNKVIKYDYGVRTRCQYPSWAYDYESNPSWSLYRREI